MIGDLKLGPLVVKTLHGQEGDAWTPYLTRVSIGRLSLHLFWRGDADQECHDHPWDFWTFPLRRAGYREMVRETWEFEAVGKGMWNGLSKAWTSHPEIENHVPGWRWSYRPAEYAHRVLSNRDGSTIVTLIWKSPKRREWGFYCPQGWRHWKAFLDRRGCE